MSWQPSRVLVPVDVPEIATEALDAALELVGQPTDLFVLHVVPAWEQEQAINWGTIDGESRADYARRDLEQRLRGTRYEGANLLITFGDAATEIATAAEQIDAELVIMATHGRSGLSRLVSGSVTEAVIRSATRPVLVIPGQQG